VVQNNNNGIMGMAGQVITWTKSYLTLAQPAPPVTNSVFVIGVYYTL
jgi:RNase P/RNase MRP subunit p29